MLTCLNASLPLAISNHYFYVCLLPHSIAKSFWALLGKVVYTSRIIYSLTVFMNFCSNYYSISFCVHIASFAILHFNAKEIHLLDKTSNKSKEWKKNCTDVGHKTIPDQKNITFVRVPCVGDLWICKQSSKRCPSFFLCLPKLRIQTIPLLVCHFLCVGVCVGGCSREFNRKVGELFAVRCF